jgi:aspartate/methionine/tyrosine aminotransferase
MNPLFAGLPTTIFETMSVLAREHGAINLGQGFPELDGHLDVRQAAARALVDQSNQYPPMLGLPELREAVAEHYGRLQGIALDFGSEVTITSGATEALAATLLALIAPGDEVVLFQPLYDAYLPLIQRAGGVARLARLEPPEFRITRSELERVVTAKTKLVVVNTPANPSARLQTAEELALLAEYCVRHDVLAVSDEVWEHLVFDGRTHQSLLATPGMRDRCVKIGSAGKIFSLTGWKVGFVCAAPHLTSVIAKAHQFLTFTTPPNLQRAVAYGLAKPAGDFDALRQSLARSRDRLVGGLGSAGLVTLPSEGTYFINLDLAASGIALDDETFCRRAVSEAGVAAIPFSAFYAEAPVRHLVRLCFAKTDPTLDEAVTRLAKARRLFA